MDGLLIVDKPTGPTSHDVVSRARRALRERRIGHTGTLDPMASGVLPLVVGRATRLARFLDGDKAYDAEVRLGFATDTFDAVGRPTTAAYDGAFPDARAIDAALDRFRGTFMQQPPAFSAKKIAGERSYAIAREASRLVSATAESGAGPATVTLPAPVAVTTRRLDLLRVENDRVHLRVSCSAGFYVRSLAHDLGMVLGTGGHLAALRRIEAAGYGLDGAVPLAVLDLPGGAAAAIAAMIPIDRMLPHLPAVTLTEDGVARVRVGRDIGPDDAAGFEAAAQTGAAQGEAARWRLLTPAGALAAVAEADRSPGVLHPVVVLM
jgi:tRNA pseudouridine55 synthase